MLRIQKIGYGLRILYQGEDGLRRLHSATITNPNPVLLTLKEFQSDGTTKHIKNARLDNYDNYIAPVRPLTMSRIPQCQHSIASPHCLYSSPS